jgi:hypothetical protein
MTPFQRFTPGVAAVLPAVRRRAGRCNFLVAALVLASAWGPHAWAIGYFESDYGVVASAPLGQPADLVHPSDSYTATWDFNGTGRASGVVIGPNWILTGGHVANDPSVKIHVGGDNGSTYQVARNAQGQPQIFIHPSLDLGLIRVVAPDGTEPNLKFIPIAAPLDFGNVPVTIAGYGTERVFDNSTGQTDGTVLGGGELRWGRNIASIKPTSLNARMDKPLDEANLPNAEYLKYESHPMGGDSGGGWFLRDGWQWQLVAVTSTGGVALPFPASPSDSSGPKIAATEVVQWIEESMGHPLPANGSPQPRPTPTLQWIGPGNGSWHSPLHWQQQDTGINQLPAFDAARADVVAIDSIQGPAITESAMVAGVRDLFVGRATNTLDPAPATISVSAGGRFNADSLFLGTEAGEFGELRLDGGALTTASQYVGFQGRGSLWHSGGTNTTVTLTVGKDSRSSDTASIYVLAGSDDPDAAPNLRAGRILVGEHAGSTGQFVMFGEIFAAATSSATIVGDSGNGSFDHHTGTHTVRNDLVIGNDLGAHGTYSMSGEAQLKTGRTTVGLSGSGSFLQSGGIHETDALHVNNSGSYTMLGGTLKTNLITGKIDFLGRNATLVADGLGNYVDAEFADAQNATLQLEPDSLVLVSGSNPFGQVINNAALMVHVVGSPIVFSAGGFHGFGDIPDPVQVSGHGYVTAVAGSERLRLPELRVADNAKVVVQPDAVLEVSSSKDIPLVVGAGAPHISVSDAATLVIAHERPGTGLRVAAGAHLLLETADSFSDDSLQVYCVQTDVLVEPHAVLTATGGINFTVGRRRLTVDGTLQVGAGVGKLDIRSLSLNSNEDVTLEMGQSGMLEIDLQRNQHDEIIIDRGSAVLQGELSLNYSDDFQPAIGEQFDILLADDSISGVFDRVTGNSVDLGLADSRDEIGLAVLYTEVEESDVLRVRASLFGDVDFDNSVDLEDYHHVLVHMGRQNATWEMGDFTGDGQVAQDDFSILLEYFGMIQNPRATSGDFDQNGIVNAADYAVWRKSLGKIGVALAADGNGDKRIDFGDYEIWRAHFGQTITAAASIAAVPEPATPFLLAASYLAALLFRRR